MPENNLFERDMGHYERVLYDEYAETYDEGLKELLGMEDIGKFAEYKVQLLSLLCHSKVGGGVKYLILDVEQDVAFCI